MNELFMAIREAINDADGAAASPDDLLDLQAKAAVEAVAILGYTKGAGWDYAVRRGDVILEQGFNTEEQARRHQTPGAELIRRPVGMWETVQ